MPLCVDLGGRRIIKKTAPGGSGALLTKPAQALSAIVIRFLTSRQSSALVFRFFKQKTAYEIRIRDWSSDVCSSD
eukprot:COSAG03_NODE_27829_length_251_cov_0.559211_1_plen_74_part_01